MRTILQIILLAVAPVLLTGCVHSRTPLLLTAKFLRPHDTAAPQRLVIELRNISRQPQRVVLLTNCFVGVVYSRDREGHVHGFIHTNLFIAMISASISNVGLERELAPGCTFAFEHALSEFINPARQSSEKATFFRPILAPEFLPGCQVWCAIDVRHGIFFVLEESRRWAKIDDWEFIKDRSGLLVSSPLEYP
jgi:hypothetical protein